MENVELWRSRDRGQHSRAGWSSSSSSRRAAGMKKATTLCAPFFLLARGSVALSALSKSDIRRAIDLSNRANADPALVGEACDLWRSILGGDDDDRDVAPLPLPRSAMPAAHAMHASTLVRGGRDRLAVRSYERALSYLPPSDDMTREEYDIRMGLGRSRQRLLEYGPAAGTFLGASRCREGDRSESSRSAATCALRCGDVGRAIDILEDYRGEDDAELEGMLLEGMLETLRYIRDGRSWSGKASESALRCVRGASSRSPLYGWVYLTMLRDDGRGIDESIDTFRGDFRAYSSVNNSPFDDPGLVRLDDKILLHRMLVEPEGGRRGFWPRGYVLPDEMDRFLERESGRADADWILKERSGYGSNGNALTTTEDVASLPPSGPVLCQSLVEPPALLNGRKFSLRVYVVYFPSGMRGRESIDAQVFLSNEGLVKLAMSDYRQDETASDDQCMTNSGRDLSAEQHDLRYLEDQFAENGWDYDAMWRSVEASARDVMGMYLRQTTGYRTDHQANDDGASHAYEPIWSLPKILGFDYMLDGSNEPFLLEVNRFPGLEPRSSVDEDVKRSVVYDAWRAACERLDVPRSFIGGLEPACYRGYSLQKLDS